MISVFHLNVIFDITKTNLSPQSGYRYLFYFINLYFGIIEGDLPSGSCVASKYFWVGNSAPSCTYSWDNSVVLPTGQTVADADTK